MWRQKLKSITLQQQRQGKRQLKVDHYSHFGNIPPCLHFTKLAKPITTQNWKEHRQSKYCIRILRLRSKRKSDNYHDFFFQARFTNRSNERAARAARTFLNQSNY